MKTCKGCGQTKPLDGFYTNVNMRDGYVNWCKPCMIERHGEKRRERAKKFRAYVQAIKVERGCADCGFNAHPAALDFDHLPGTLKMGKMASMACGSALKTIHAEIDKCEVVCANCHRIRTADRLRKPANAAPRTASASLPSAAGS